MFDVAIVGYGPVGATLAGLLGKLGLQVVVFDKTKEIYPKPRAVGFDHDAMRIFQRIGISDLLSPFIEPFREGIYIGADDQIIQHVKHMPAPYPLTWPPHFTCDQPGVESILRSTNQKLSNITTYLGCEFTRFNQTSESVLIDYLDTNLVPNHCEARFLVGCDGASSLVRNQMGIQLESFEYDEPWIVVDMKVNEEVLDTLPKTNVQYCKPKRPSTFISCPGNHRRWEFMTLPEDTVDDTVTDAYLWELLSPWLKPGQAEIWRAASYRFHALVALDWQDGRVFLAGDSAHQTPPFLGQGMCQGLRDAVNLAWKLHHVVAGLSTHRLLNTYTQERRPNVVETTKLAKEFGKIISERDPFKAKLRDEKILNENHGNPRTIIRQNLIPGFTDGLVATDTPLAGSVFPQPLVDTDTRLGVMFDDLLEPCFRLVMLADKLTERETETIERQAASYGIPVVLMHTELLPHIQSRPDFVHVLVAKELIKKWLQNASAIGAIVRPDHYVYSGITHASDAIKYMGLLISHLKQPVGIN
jgi:3-(3-hydroxy-phenyl)propionate hydroxylase